MGRMADLWKSADSGPATPLPVPGALSAIDAVPGAAPMPDAMDDDDDVPFIEVGGPRPVMKHLESISPRVPSEPRIEPMRRPAGLPRAEEPARGPAMTVMNVRFETVHVGRMSGRALGPEFVTYHQPNHAVSVQYRSLIAEIATQLPGAKPRAILIASASAGAGATTVAINLGITLAKQDETRVTLVDANFERPDLAGKLGVGGSPGMRDVLARKTPLAWSLQETMQPNLFALPAGRMEAPSAAVPAPIIEQLRSRSEWIVVDAGPWTANLLPMAEACDAVYLVHSDADTSASERINAILGACGRLRGCVVTMR